jgi:glycosyltransferase involved in cell wall biosynthesis
MGNRIHTEVIHYWQRKNIEVELLCFDAGLRQDVFEILDGIPVYRLPIGHSVVGKALNDLVKPFLHYPFFPGLFSAYRRFLEHRRYDFAHVETAFPLGVVASLLPRHLHAPMAVTLPGADVMAEPAYDYGYGRYANVRWLLQGVWRQSALVRADSRYIRRRAIELGCPPEKVVAIPYNITDSDFPPAAPALAEFKASARAELIRRHNLTLDTRIVLSLSRLHPFKGVEFLIKAVPATLSAAPRTVFLIAGPRRSTATFGDYASYLERLAGELGAAEAVRLIGGLPHEDVPLYLAGADAVVVPSVVEALNRVAIEAAAFSTPAVVTRTTGISEYMVEHGYGLVVEPQSPAAIAAALRIILADPRRQRAIGAHGPELAAQFRSDVIADDLLRSYQEALLASSEKIEYSDRAKVL